MMDKEHILYCDCAYYDFLDPGLKSRIIRAVQGSEREWSLVPDLCGLCADGDERLIQWAGHEKLIIIACCPRAVKWLFHAGGVELKEQKVEFFNARDEDDVQKLFDRFSSPTSEKETPACEKNSDWVPWFPVIDYSRCINCSKCLDFCLFGTYELSTEGRVEVRHPEACKTNCPACARVCPQSAIIFPKHDEPPINGAEVAESEQNAPGTVHVDHEELVNGDIYEKLRNRGAGKRFSQDAPPEGKINEVRKILGIPEDVMADLSPQEISRIRKNIKGDKTAPSEPQRGDDDSR